MRIYRAFVMGDNGRFIGSHILEDVETDEGAIQAGRGLIENNAVEIWQGDRRVAQIDRIGEIRLFNEGLDRRPVIGD